MNRAALLGGTAIAALFAANAAMAGNVGTGDNLEVSIYGEVRTSLSLQDQDDQAGKGRGYDFHTDEAELGLEARNTADNGLLYGVEIVLNVNTDDDANADKAYAFIDSDNLGRVELGDQDDAIDRMFVAAEDVMVGRAGFDGEFADVFRAGDTWFGVQNNSTGKATKATYFSPRIAGFQVGASLTPDSGAAGASFGERDDDGDFENTFGFAANFVGDFEGFEIVVSGIAEFGTGEPDTAGGVNNTSVEDNEIYGVGATVGYGGFSLGAGFVDLGDSGVSSSDSAAGADAGQWWNVGIGYRSGPWGISIAYYEAEISNASGVSDTNYEVISVDAEYEIAPGWVAATSINFADAENRDRTAGNDNDGIAALFYNIFTF